MYIEYKQPEFHSPEAAVCEVLPRALGFTAADLAGNREGRLSTAQMVHLVRQVATLAGRMMMNSGLLLSLLIGLAIYAGVLGGMLSLGLPINIFKRGVSHFWFAAWAVASMISSLIFVLAGVLGRKAGLLIRLFRLGLDLAFGQVTSYSGRISTNRSTDFDDPLSRRLMKHFIWAGEEKFEVPREAYLALEEQDCLGFYTLYFTPRSRFLVSAEPATAAQLASQRLIGATPPTSPPPSAPPPGTKK